jgi:cation diffusion facilitator CzcD-associated flavoprotein CzcO
MSNTQPDQLGVVVIGAGFAGMYAWHSLRGIGMSIHVYEAGESYHAGGWPHDGVDFSGLHPGVIGTGEAGTIAAGGYESFLHCSRHGDVLGRCSEEVPA